MNTETPAPAPLTILNLQQFERILQNTAARGQNTAARRPDDTSDLPTRPIPTTQWHNTLAAQRTRQRRGEPVLHWSVRLATQYLNWWYHYETTQPDMERLQNDVHLQFRFIDGIQLRWLHRQLLEEYMYTNFTYDTLKDRAFSLHQKFEEPANRQCRFRYGIPNEEDLYREYFMHLNDFNCSVGNPAYYKSTNSELKGRIGLSCDCERPKIDYRRPNNQTTPTLQPLADDNNNNEAPESAFGSANNHIDNITTEPPSHKVAKREEDNPTEEDKPIVQSKKRKYSPDWIEQQRQIVDDVFNHYLNTTKPKKE